MALSGQSLFLYGYTVSSSNQNIDFKISGGGSQLTAVIPVGNYSLTSLMAAIKTAMQTADTANTYTVSASRTLSGGTQNRVTIATSGAFLSLLFLTGTNTATSPATLLGFTVTDKTGATTYTGSSTTGTAVLTSSTLPGYNYLSPDFMKEQKAAINLSSSGNKETLVYATYSYWQVQFKYVTSAVVISDWNPLFVWMTKQNLIEFTPDVTAPSTFYEGWLEACAGSSNGTAFVFKEMLPNFPSLYDIGLMKFRVKPT